MDGIHHNPEDAIKVAKNADARIEFNRPIRQAPEPEPTIDTMRVVSTKDGWALMVEDVKEPAWVVSTKRKAVRAARAAADHHDAKLVVQTTDGRVSKTYDYRMS